MLNLAWNLKYRKICLELDLAKAFALIEHRCSMDNPNLLLFFILFFLLIFFGGSYCGAISKRLVNDIILCI